MARFLTALKTSQEGGTGEMASEWADEADRQGGQRNGEEEPEPYSGLQLSVDVSTI